MFAARMGAWRISDRAEAMPKAVLPRDCPACSRRHALDRSVYLPCFQPTRSRRAGGQAVSPPPADAQGTISHTLLRTLEQSPVDRFPKHGALHRFQAIRARF